MRQQLWACLHKLDDEEDDDRIIELFDTLPDQAMFELTLAELEAPACAAEEWLSARPRAAYIVAMWYIRAV